MFPLPRRCQFSENHHSPSCLPCIHYTDHQSQNLLQYHVVYLTSSSPVSTPNLVPHTDTAACLQPGFPNFTAVLFSGISWHMPYVLIAALLAYNAYAVGHDEMLSKPLGSPMNRYFVRFGIRYGTNKERITQLGEELRWLAKENNGIRKKKKMPRK